MGWTETKNAARASVHRAFQRGATYTPPVGDPVPVQVRVLRRDVKFGNYDGIGYADMAAAPVEIVFLLSEVPAPEQGANVTLDASGEQFVIDTPLEPYPPTINCEAHPV